MKRHPLPPLDDELILVHSNGIAQWLKMALAADAAGAGGEAGGLGIAAGLAVSLPARFFWQAYRSLLGREAVPASSPFDKDRLLWRLLRLLPQVGSRPEYGPLRAFLAHDDEQRKCFQLAERLADLFDQYQVYRADWLAAWAAGSDVLSDRRGNSRPLPAGQRWQAALWRALLADVVVGGASAATAMTSRAAVHAAFLERARQWTAPGRPDGLPGRVLVFGISSLPQQALEVLAVLARWTQVLICVHNPCRHHWADIVADRDLLRRSSGRQSRRPGMPGELPPELLHAHAQPLLAAWGKQGRDFIDLLDECDGQPAERPRGGWTAASPQRIELFATCGTASLLQQLQDDILDLRPLPETRACWPAVDPRQDSSLRFHVAHSAQREVEILHDQLLAACNADPSLRPHDIIVMVPDIGAYAAHVQAVFGLLPADDPRHLPFTIVDQSRRQCDPLLQALEKLLALPRSRLAASDVLDLLEVPALRRRFAISEEDLPLLHRWIRGAGIRWGLHAEHRASFGLPRAAEEAAANTWLFGCRRMLLGYAVGTSAGAWRGIEPHDEIGGIDAALLGPLLQLIERLQACWQTLRSVAPAATWCVRLRQLLADFFAADDAADAFTLLQLEGALQRWQEACDAAALSADLPLSVVGAHWLASLDGGGLTQRFFAGAITFATLMPMRAIPFRRVCLLGMNDGDYPRSRTATDFDLMAGDHRPGDRSRREDDRYLFLEAVLSAREHLHISWVGRSINDNRPRPPSVLVGQLRDHLAAGWRLAAAGDGAPAGGVDAGTALLAALTVEHRLQPFSADYFPTPATAAGLFTYAREWQADALPPADGQRPGNAAPLPPPARDEPLSLRELEDFLAHPVRSFFRQRLGVVFAADDPAGEDQEPFVVDGLARWQLQDELIAVELAALQRGEDIGAAGRARLAAIERRGALPAGAFGEVLGEELLAPLDDLFARHRQALARWPLAVAGEHELCLEVAIAGQPLQIADWLGGVRNDGADNLGQVVVDSRELVDGQRVRGDSVVRHWLRHLAMQVAVGPLTTLLLGKQGDVELAPLPPDAAAALLRQFLLAWHDGMRRPLPLAVRAAFAWLHSGREDDARKVYDGGEQQPGEVDRDPCLRRVYPDFQVLSAGGEFFVLAERLLRPLHAALPAAAPRRGRRPVATGEAV
ncbi:MAG: exodeoxyribonuclease V subunit gamma [Candidatus Accumulibacter sp.]|nr:exodeoxyribonuclease V subunit gamma [Accumulibacter sp.]MCM8636199.1 exodeoxyribonuclease V subunit gamma [Accumulibacter sp.]MCM8640598.1 exodeoxyribonuclease V subunit gamma [Accumulibacter sp.]